MATPHIGPHSAVVLSESEDVRSERRIHESWPAKKKRKVVTDSAVVDRLAHPPPAPAMQ